jgi:TRAP-type C4-dicarboxylate transport system substrate-binding protein
MRRPILLNSICIMAAAIFLIVALPGGGIAEETFKLKYATHMTARHGQYNQGSLVWLKKIEEATGGRVKVTPYPSQTLCKGRDTLEAVKGGIADIGTAFVGFFPGRFPITEVAFLPCMNMSPNSTAVSSTRAIMDAYNTFPEMQKEFADVKFLTLHSIEPAFVATQNKPVRKLGDLNGLKMRIAGVYITEFMKAQGAVPMLMPPSALYENMQKKVIDGYAYSWDGFMSRKLYEVTDSVLEARWYVGAFFTVMNRDVWNSLPKDIQEAIDKVTNVDSAVQIAKQIDSDRKPALKKCDERGIKVFTLSEAEMDKWKKASKPIWDAWVEKVSAKGISRDRAEEILDTTMKIYSKYK